MALGPCLVDKSVLARRHKPVVSAALMPYLGQLATCSTVELEIGWSATSREHYALIMDDLSWCHHLDVDQRVLDLASVLQRSLVDRGHHRGPGVPDLGLAATAITHSALVLHYDRDFDLIAAVDERLQHRWIVARGTADI